jgi:RNA polymerase sigma-70 factor (ECF subfamily)
MTASSNSPSLDALLVPLPAESAACPVALPETKESRLIRRAQAGDHAAFRLLVEVHQEMIHRVCLQWLSCAEDAGEACQDTFFKAWQALPAWQPRSRLGTWLYQIALNQCRDRAKSRAFRQRAATTHIDHLPASSACPSASPDLAAVHADDMVRLRRGLAALPAPAREVLILCAMEGLSYQEASVILKCSSRAIEGRLYRARHLLLDWWHQPSRA